MADTPSLIKLLTGQETIQVNAEQELTDKGFDYWLNRPYVPNDLRQDLIKANVLIVPLEQFRDIPHNVFPIQTVELLEYIKEHAPKGVTIDLCSSDQDYRELALHGDIIQIATMVITFPVLHIIMHIVASYIYDRVGLGFDKAQVKSELYVDKDGETILLKYDGPAKEYETTLKTLLDKSKAVDNPEKEL